MSFNVEHFLNTLTGHDVIINLENNVIVRGKLVNGQGSTVTLANAIKISGRKTYVTHGLLYVRSSVIISWELPATHDTKRVLAGYRSRDPYANTEESGSDVNVNFDYDPSISLSPVDEYLLSNQLSAMEGPSGYFGRGLGHGRGGRGARGGAFGRRGNRARGRGHGRGQNKD